MVPAGCRSSPKAQRTRDDTGRGCAVAAARRTVRRRPRLPGVAGVLPVYGGSGLSRRRGRAPGSDVRRRTVRQGCCPRAAGSHLEAVGPAAGACGGGGDARPGRGPATLWSPTGDRPGPGPPEQREFKGADVLHLRLIVPADLTETVQACLDDAVGVTHVAVLSGAARRPPGDVVLCDVAREAADELLEALRACGLGDRGAIAMEQVDLSLSRFADRAEEEAPGEGADALVWEAVTEATHEESALTVTYLAFMVLATTLAACGAVLDSAILVVGAMVVGPEFGPLAGLCVALVQRRPRLALRSLQALVVGFVVAMVLTVGFALLMDRMGLFTQALFESARPNTSFIWKPDWLSFVVAFLAGIAGLLSLTSAKSGALVGVAISVTTVPAAANAAVALAYGDIDQAVGSAQQLGFNLLGIVVAGTLTLLVQHRLWALVRRGAGPA